MPNGYKKRTMNVDALAGNPSRKPAYLGQILLSWHCLELLSDTI